MSRIKGLFAAAAILAVTAIAPVVAAECVMPGPAPMMPQGVSASKKEMAAGKVTLDEYVGLVESFKACQQKRISSAPKSTKEAALKNWRNSLLAADDAITAIKFQYQAQSWAYANRTR
jgi:hypothetical protein